MENTDETHEYTLKDLMALYEENGTPATPKTVRNDLTKLVEAGFPVIETAVAGNPTYYSYEQRFDSSELKMIIDAVSAARFISPKNSQALISKLLTLTSREAAREIALDADVSGHNDTPNRNLYITIQTISEAIALKKKIRYQYYDYSLEKKRILHNNGETYTYSPYGFAWNEDRYYLLGRVDKRPDTINPIRVDLLCHVEVTDEDVLPAPSDFAPKKYSDKVFRMFGGEETDVTLEADNDLVKKFIDRFGQGFELSRASDTTFYATVHVSVSPTFFSWIFQYNGRVSVAGPPEVRDRYTSMLRRILSYHEKLSRTAQEKEG